MRLAPLLALPPIALGIAAAVWMVSSAPGPARVEGAAPALPEVIWRHPDLEPGRLIPEGTEVLRIDPADYELALAQSRADLAALEAERAQLDAEAENTARILALEQ